MKKLYISCPMRGRKIEDIEKTRDKLHKIAEIIWDQKLEVIDNYISGNIPATNSIAIWNIGENIKKMATADYFICIDKYSLFNEFPGASVEYEVAKNYGLEIYAVYSDKLVPDIYECNISEKTILTNDVKS